MTALSLALNVAALALLGVLLRLVLRRQAESLARLDALTQSVERLRGFAERRKMRDSLSNFVHAVQKPPGLQPGEPAPAFALPDVSGAERTLEGFGGKKLLLVFFNPDCGFCVQMAPDLAALPADGAGGPLPVVIASGSQPHMRELAAEHQLRCPILFDAKGEVGARYQMTGTPSGYLIDRRGSVASPLTVGAAPLFRLADEAKPEAVEESKAKPKGKVGRGLEHSKILRTGLTAGTPAPDFTLPRVGGGEVALAGLRGRKVLLAFSDPECGPCQEVATRLEAIHRSRPDVSVVLVSRRGEEVNLKKAADLGLTFPVVMQKSWEVSKLYGIFETPVGYLIGEDGVLVHDVARGVGEIAALVDAPAAKAA